MDPITYFSQPGFQRLIKLMAQRYRGLGRIGGNAVLNNLTPDERQAIGGLLGKDLSKKRSVLVGILQFQQALEQTRYAGTDLIELMSAILGKDLIPKTEEEQAQQRAREKFFYGLAQEHPHALCQDWIRHIEAGGPGTRTINQAYTQNPKLLKTQLGQALTALAKLPSKDSYRRLPLWAAKIIGDPHGFDPNTSCGKYLISALQFVRNQQDGTRIMSNLTGEQTWELLDQFGIIRDDLLNFVTCCGLISDNPMWETAYSNGSVINAPVRELAKLQYIRPVKGDRVFIIENSGLFSHLTDADNFSPMVCTHGQFRLASYMLLDKLAETGVELWYSGDFDSEGLLMAQRLWERYPDQVKLWRYSPEDYRRCLSNISIPPRRLKQLEKIHVPTLIPTAEAIIKAAKAGYQENMADSLAADMNNQPQGPME